MKLPLGVGAIIAIVVLILAIVFMAVGEVSFAVGGMIAALAVARLVP